MTTEITVPVTLTIVVDDEVAVRAAVRGMLPNGMDASTAGGDVETAVRLVVIHAIEHRAVAQIEACGARVRAVDVGE